MLSVRDLSIPDGQFVSILGASGSGKSTLLRLIARLLTPGFGSINRDAKNMGMVFQSPNLIPWRTAQDNVRLPAELGEIPQQVDDRRIAELFDLVGLRPTDLGKRPAELSGGMQMRVSLARSLVLQPKLMLLDEPFAALDDLLRMQLEEDVRRIHNQRSLTTVLVTHNIHEAVFMSDRVLVLGGIPSAIRADIDIPLPADRSGLLRNEGSFHELVYHVSKQLRGASEGVGQ